MINNLSILCSSCLDFSDMWENQFLGLDTHWKNHPNIFLVTDALPANFEVKDREIIIDNEQFSDRLIFALKHIKTEFVLLTLDDYLVSREINDNNFIKIINYMEKNNVDYCKLRKARYGKFIDRKNKIKSLELKYTYEVSLLPGLWKKDSLLKILKSGLTPWQTEVSLTVLSKQQSLKCISLHSNKTYPYVDVVRKGKYLRKAFKYLNKNGYYVSDRKKMPVSESFIRWMRQLIFNCVPLKIREKISNKKGNKSYSGSNVIDN